MADGRPPRTSYPATVSAVEHLLPRLIGVTFTGPTLSDLPDPAPGGHLRIAFVEEEPAGEEARYLRRTFTPRRFDRATGELYVEFVLHGPGLAADWARRAAPGDPVVISGVGGRYRPQAVDGRFVIAVDDAGIPAAATVAEALPPDTELLVLCEVEDVRDERPLTPARDVPVTWLHRAAEDGTQTVPGDLLEAAVRSLPDGLRAGWFVAGEARTVRQVHRHLLDEREVPPEHAEARGYWRRRQAE